MNAPADNLLRTGRQQTMDTDPLETQEWLDALQSVVQVAGQDRALALLRLLEEQAQQLGIVANVPPYSAYRNTIPAEREGAYPGDLAIEERLTSIMRWNALANEIRAFFEDVS
jgi:pyruvate dehydrogenase E1 component